MAHIFLSGGIKERKTGAILPSFALSDIDVFAKTTLTLWACGCGLKCPFCHNWRNAEFKAQCIKVSAEGLLRVADYVLTNLYPLDTFKIDYIHVTGGEPLLTHSYAEALRELGGRFPLSINSSLTVSEKAVDAVLDAAKHFAFDLKLPFGPMIGLPPKAAGKLWERFWRNARRVLESGVEVEVRVPYSKLTKPWMVEEVLRRLDGDYSKAVLRIYPLVGKPLDVRNPGWPHYKYKLDKEEEEELKRIGKELGFKAVAVKNYAGSVF